MISFCKHDERKRHGKDRKGNQRFRCKDCGTTFAETAPKPLGNMRIDPAKAELALSLLLEGMSIRATERITKLHRDTRRYLPAATRRKANGRHSQGHPD